ncbi:MAG: methionyl-tRNA formyltransferase, partial [Dehalococcoidia bacterium]
MRVVFMGTPEFAVPCLEGLLRHHQVVAVYTQPDRRAGRGRSLVISPVKRLALARGLPVRQPASLKPEGVAEELERLRPEVIVVAAYGQILPRRVLHIPPRGCLNVHPSLLPRHRGSSPVASAILDGDEFTGVSIMLLDEGLDTGPILAQTRLAIEPQDTTGSLTAKLSELGAQLLVETLALWLERKLESQPQGEEGATYSRPLTKEDGVIDWRLPAQELARRIRALQPWPGCYSWWRSRLLRIMEAVPRPGEGKPEPGRVRALGRGVGV